MDYPKYTREQLHSFDDLPSAVLVNVLDENFTLRYAYSNPFMAASLGYEHEELKALLTEDCFAAIYDLDRSRAQNARADVMQGKIVDSISRQKRKDGSFVWILAHLRRIELDGQMGMLFLFSRIQELIGLQNSLQDQNKEWRDILQSVPIGLHVFKIEDGITTTISCNQFLIDFANAVGSQLDSNHRDWTEAEIAMIFNQDIYAFCDNEDIPKIEKMLAECAENPVASCVFRLRGSSSASTVYIYSTCLSKLNENGSRTYYVTYQNVTEYENRRVELIEKRNQLYELSYHDALTGVKNRHAYNEYMDKCNVENIHNVGMAFCDVNGLKDTNDNLGHYYGDQLICSFVGILKSYFPKEAIYRISGDEFVIISPDTKRDDFIATMRALIEDVRNEGNLASIGYIWNEDVSDLQNRSVRAEQIMYVEKQKYYDEHRRARSKHRSMFMGSILEDFDAGRFVMYLQPKTSIDDSTVIGAEALVRKIDKNGNVVLPYEFVPRLEHEKLITKLDYYMLDKACEFLQKLHKAGNDSFVLSVNISRISFVENDFMETVVAIIDKYDFPRGNLEFELTETNETMDSLRQDEYLGQLKELGVKLSIDDMGTEYSTLSLLTMGVFDWVKLDRSIVMNLDQEKTKILIRHMIAMCHDLKQKVIAEGVETHEERLALKEMGCDAFQGFLKSKPIPASEFEERFLT